MTGLVLGLVTTFALVSPQAGLAATDIVWSRQFGTTKDDDVHAVAVDRHGDAYVVGMTPGTFAGRHNHGYYDGYVRKVSASGTHKWTVQFGTSQLDDATGVAVGRDDLVYVVGNDDDGAFLRRMRPTGTTVWVRHYGRNAARGWAVVVRKDATVVIGGDYTGADDDADAFIRAYSSGGTALWTRRFGTAAADGVRAIAAAPAGGLYLAGHTAGSLGAANAGDDDVFLRRTDAAGKTIWTRQFGTGQDDGAGGVATGPSGDVYVVGGTRGALDGPPVPDQEGDAFTRAYDTTGAVEWTDTLDVDFFASGSSIAVGADGRIHAVGSILGTAPGVSGDGDDGYLRTYAQDGMVLGTLRLGSDDDGDTAVDVAMGPGGDAYVAGWTEGALPGKKRVGHWDGFLVRARV